MNASKLEHCTRFASAISRINISVHYRCGSIEQDKHAHKTLLLTVISVEKRSLEISN